MLKISTHYGHRISSTMLNERIQDLFGRNCIVRGFDSSCIDGDMVLIGPGLCLINGAFIEFDLISRINYDNKNYLTIRYDHKAKNAFFEFADEIDSDSVKVADVVKNSTGINFKLSDCVHLIDDLDEKFNEITKKVKSSNSLGNLASKVMSNNSRIDTLEDVIDSLLIPSIVDLDYRRITTHMKHHLKRKNME